jgi:hypothetical protein
MSYKSYLVIFIYVFVLIFEILKSPNLKFSEQRSRDRDARAAGIHVICQAETADKQRSDTDICEEM